MFKISPRWSSFFFPLFFFRFFVQTYANSLGDLAANVAESLNFHFKSLLPRALTSIKITSSFSLKERDTMVFILYISFKSYFQSITITYFASGRAYSLDSMIRTLKIVKITY